MPSLVPHSVGHVDFLLTEQVGAHPSMFTFQIQIEVPGRLRHSRGIPESGLTLRSV